MLCTFGWSAASRKVFAKKDVPNAVLSWSDVWKRVYPAGLTAALDIGLSNLAIATGLHINIYTVRSRTTRVDRNPQKKKRGGGRGKKETLQIPQPLCAVRFYELVVYGHAGPLSITC